MRSPLGITLLAASASLACQPRPVASPGRPAPAAVVVRGTVVRGDGNTLPDAAVLVEGNRIVRVAPASELRAPAGARVVGDPGAWIVPGLFDTHVHFFQSGGLYT